MNIIQEKNGGGGAFKALYNDVVAGEMTYIWRDDDKMLIDHTGVDSAFEGQGIGKRLLMQVVDFARENSLKIIPVCPFVVALFHRIPSIRDVLADCN
jgi:predicted GNAT family acetyltransferase